MLFYTSLFIACVFAAFLAIWAYHAIADASQAIMATMLPRTKKGPTSHLGTQTQRNRKHGTQTPWGWKNHQTPATIAKTHAAKPQHTSFDDLAVTGSKKSDEHRENWVRRENKSELGGNAYKVTRQANATAEGFKQADRPWGW